MHVCNIQIKENSQSFFPHCINFVLDFKKFKWRAVIEYAPCVGKKSTQEVIVPLRLNVCTHTAWIRMYRKLETQIVKVTNLFCCDWGQKTKSLVSGHQSASKSVQKCAWKKKLASREIRDTLYMREPNFPYIQSMVAKGGLTNQANVHTPMWKSHLKHNRSSNFGCNWTSFHSKKNKKLTMLMRWSEVTRAETRNRRLFWGLTRKYWKYSKIICIHFNLNSLDNKGSWRILKDFYCSVTMLRELGIMNWSSADDTFQIRILFTFSQKWQYVGQHNSSGCYHFNVKLLDINPNSPKSSNLNTILHTP